jgi:hypothetical protein
MSNSRTVRGFIVRSQDSYYFLPEARLEEYKLPADAAQGIEAWLQAEDVSGHMGGAAPFVTRVEIDAAGQDDDFESARKAFDPIVSAPSGYIRRCLNVVPDDLKELLDRLDLRS